ncbi:MAG: hypothetical protein M3Q50_03655, partial [Chloroflexota bacterium]|nr:hypothetical protein [Chloroflexota bacterium]
MTIPDASPDHLVPSAVAAEATDRRASDAEGALRQIPSVTSIAAAARGLGSALTDDALQGAARGELAHVRAALLAGERRSREEIERGVVAAILALDTPRLRPIINATGVIIHTNLGRAPVSEQTAAAMQA